VNASCLSPPHSCMLLPSPQAMGSPILPLAVPFPLPSPRAMRRTRMIRIMVGLMGSAALISISSSVMPMTDSSTMARSSWFHLLSQAEEAGVESGDEHSGSGIP
jgi:hypothetical protein